MRNWLVGRLIAASVFVCGSSAHADAIVQNVTGSLRGGSPVTLFDPSLGTLNSVDIEGTMEVYASLLRTTVSQPEVNLPRSMGETLTLSYNGGTADIAGALLYGSETYAEGSMFGNFSVSGPVSNRLTGADMNPFITGNGTWPYIMPETGVVVPSVGIAQYPGASFSIRITYEYGSLPEPSTWVMMLLGFGAIGIAMQHKRARVTAAC